MKRIAFFGGTGGLGKEVINYLDKDKYQVDIIGSRDINFSKLDEIDDFFNHYSSEIIIIFTNHNHDSFIHKLDRNDLIKQTDVNIIGINRCITDTLFNMRNKSYGRIIIASSVLVDSPVVGT